MDQRYETQVSERNNQNGSQPKKLILRTRERIPVETTQGSLYARDIVTGDLATFARYADSAGTQANADYEALGKLALLTLVCPDDGKERVPALDEESFNLLTAADVTALIKAVAKACELESPATIETLSALGSALFAYLSRIAKQMAESAAAIKKNIDSTFGSLPTTLRSNLGDKFSALSAARNALGTSSAVEAIRRAQERTSTILGTAPGSSSSRIGTAFEPPDTTRFQDYKAFIPPAFEETTAGRTAARAASASEESARQLAEVAGLMGKMADDMAALQTAFLGEVLPEWFRNLEEGANTTNTTLRQAESSLFWAKWALVASVVVSVLMTGWQVWLAREYKLENDKQQESTELLMRQQLKAMQDLNSQLEKKLSHEIVAHEARGIETGKATKGDQPPSQKLVVRPSR